VYYEVPSPFKLNSPVMPLTHQSIGETSLLYFSVAADGVPDLASAMLSSSVTLH